MTTRGHTHRLFVVLALLLAAAPAARALDDGGGRSVFAIGAGNRALALGGAYSAVADDASALVWNPGGLGRIDRKQVLATQTTLFGLGFNEQFAGVVLPSWRLGTTSVVFRRFGVDGIEERDDRGVLLDDDLADTELEIALGWGRALGRGIALGGAVKLQRQTLGIYSGSGLGLDLGVLAEPLVLLGARQDGGGLTAALAVRNLVEPSIRLDEDSVPDPTALRAGLAYRLQAGAAVGLLAAVDVEKTEAMDSRLHAGCEATVLDLLALRVGSHAGDLTAGAGIRWHGLGFDYQYEDNPLAAIHRFGVGVAFGPTVQESRHRAQQAEAAALQARLDAAFAARSRAQADRVAQEARRAVDAGRWDDALDLAGTLAVLAPTDARTATLAAAAWRGRGQDQEAQGDLTAAAVSYTRALDAVPGDEGTTGDLARVRAESARRAERGRELRQRFENAMDAFARDDLLAARAGFRTLLRLAPQDADALTMARRTDEAIAHRAAFLLERARAALAAGRLDAAAEELAQARELDAAAPGVAGVENELARARRAAAAPPPPGAGADAAPAARAQVRTAAAEPADPERRREVADLYRRGVTALEAGRTADAIGYWELVWSAWPGYEGVGEHLAQEYLTLGMEAFAAGRLQEAVDRWESALRFDPDDDRARGYLERAHQQLERMERITGGK